jgi:hypothetical protein
MWYERMCRNIAEIKTTAKKGLVKGVGLVLLTFVLTACGAAKVPDTIDTDTIVVNKDGSVTSYLVRNFDKDYYDLSELTVMARQETSDYNSSAGTDAVTARTIELLSDGSRVEAVYDYTSYEWYNDFNDGNILYGTAADISANLKELSAFEEKPDFTALLSVKDKSKADVSDFGDKHAVVTDEKAVIYCPYNVAYLSENAVLLSDGSVDATEAEGTVVIVLKK